MQKIPFSLSHTRDKTSFPFLYQAQKPTMFLILFTNMRLSTSLILEVCRTLVIYEIHSGRASECGI